jgi:hypothetical protein
MESIQVRWGTADSLPEFNRERGEKDRELTGGSLVRSDRTKVTRHHRHEISAVTREEDEDDSEAF